MQTRAAPADFLLCMSPLATFIIILRDLSRSNIFSNTTRRVWTAGLNLCWNSLHHHLATVDQTPEAAAAFMVMSCSSKPQQTGERNQIIQPPRCQCQSASVLANFELHSYAVDDDHEEKRSEEKVPKSLDFFVDYKKKSVCQHQWLIHNIWHLFSHFISHVAHYLGFTETITLPKYRTC